MPLPVPPLVGAENKDQREEEGKTVTPHPFALVKFCHPASRKVGKKALAESLF